MGYHCEFYGFPFVSMRCTATLTFRNKTTPLYSYGQASATATGGDSSLFNAMIFPFTRMVIYGTIWYQGIIALKTYAYTFMILVFR